MVRIKNKTEFLAGLIFAGFGAVTFAFSIDYPMGTAHRMGPGYFPIVLSVLLILIGIVVALRGAAFTSEVVEVPKFAWRPIMVGTVAVVVFGLIIDSMGLLVATAAMVLVSRLARPEYRSRWMETVILAVLISITCSAVFYFGLKVQMPLLPVWLG
jgi:hypothetical protein